MKAKSPAFFYFISFYFEKGGIKSFKNVKGGMYQKRLGTTGLEFTAVLHYLYIAGRFYFRFFYRATK